LIRSILPRYHIPPRVDSPRAGPVTMDIFGNRSVRPALCRALRNSCVPSWSSQPKLVPEFACAAGRLILDGVLPHTPMEQVARHRSKLARHGLAQAQAQKISHAGGGPANALPGGNSHSARAVVRQDSRSPLTSSRAASFRGRGIRVLRILVRVAASAAIPCRHEQQPVGGKGLSSRH